MTSGTRKRAGGIAAGAMLLTVSALVALNLSAAADAQTSCGANNETELGACITSYNSAAAGTTTVVSLGSNIELTAALPIIDNSTTEPRPRLVIEGNGRTIDANRLPAIPNVLGQADGDVSIVDVTLTGSVGDGYDSRVGPTRIERSTITGNRQGIFASAPDGFTVHNSTIYDNDDEGITIGAGDPLSVTLTTIAKHGGFGIANNGSPTLTLTDSLLTLNSGGDCENIVNVNGGGNAVGTTSCTGISLVAAVDAELADNGCTQPCTQTLGIPGFSAAIDVAGVCGDPSDQRGAPRAPATCDAGAYEAGDCRGSTPIITDEELSVAIGCFNRGTEPTTTTLTLANDIVMTRSLPTIGTETEPGPTLVIEGAGHMLDWSASTTATGLFQRGGTLAVLNTTLANSSTALYALGPARTRLTGSTLTGNTQGVLKLGSLGPGESPGSMQIVNSTFHDNVTAISSGFDSSSFSVVLSTIVDSRGDAVSASSNISMTGTIIARSTGADCAGTASVVMLGGSASADGTCGGTVDPLLGSFLAANLSTNSCVGSCAPTMALLTGSSALDAAGACSEAVDQRGVARNQQTCDSGAFELGDRDADGDGFQGPLGDNSDCDDTDPQAFPGATEIPNDGIDQDCNGSDLIVALCNSLAVTINMNTNGGNGTGTAGNDVILGTPGDDSIDGLAGNDTICAGDGNDQVLGGDGDDTIFGEGGRDILRGNPGVDTMSGGDGNDRVLGGIGNDIMNGDAGDDYLGGFGGNDTIDGGPGNETIFGGFGADTINGGDGNDTVFGLIGDDTINGGAGNDKLNGDRGNDTINGGPGNDTILGGNANDVLNGDAGDDSVSGGKADDTLSGGPDIDVCTGNLHNLGDTADNTCETKFGIP